MKSIYIFLSIVLISFFSCKEKKPEIIETVVEKPKPKPILKYGFNINNYKVINDTINNGESFGVIMGRHRVAYSKINEVATKIKDTFDVRHIRAGKSYTVLTSKDSTEQAQVFIYKHNKIRATIINFQDSIVKAYTHKEPVKIVERKVTGEIVSNFSQAMDTLGLKPNLAHEVADIYAWTVDFLRLQKKDSFKIIFEEKFINDTVAVGYGNIKAAVFTHKGRDLYAYRFIADSLKQTADYYDNKGDMLRRQFLKSPIKFQYRISSRYNLRRRIKLYGNKVRPHRGTDFAAPYGTPIMTTANGTVTKSERRGGNGNYVKIRHNSTYSTQYLHMKRRNVKVGDYVKQGDIIGWVGMTGNTSGPHVCYRFWKNGYQVDPFKQKLPSSKPMNDSLKPKFFEFIKPMKQQLDEIKPKKGDELIEIEEEIIAKN